jgi:hypothetical protein
MSNSSNASATAGSIEAATQAFESILTGSDQDNEEQDEAQQEDEPSDDQDEGEQPEGQEDEGEESEESEDDEPEDESEESEEAEDEEQAEAVYTIKLDGKEIEVPASELVKGYQRTADYTRKTQELAGFRRQVEAVAQESVALREQYAQKLAQVDQILQQQIPQEPNWEQLRAEDPIEFAAQWADYQRRAQVQQQMMAERQVLQQRRAQEEMMQKHQILEQGRQVLTQAIPEWSNPEVAKAERAALKDYGKRFGYSEEELGQVEDPRAVVLLRKAMLFDRMQQRRGQITPAKKTSSPVLKPSAAVPQSAKKTSQTTRAKQRLAKTGSVRDAAELFKNFL